MAGDWSDADVVHHHAESGAVFYARSPGCCASGAHRCIPAVRSERVVVPGKTRETVKRVARSFTCVDKRRIRRCDRDVRIPASASDVIADNRCGKLIRWPDTRDSASVFIKRYASDSCENKPFLLWDLAIFFVGASCNFGEKSRHARYNERSRCIGQK